MAQFSYRAKDRDGQGVTGQVTANSMSDALAQLDGEGLAVVSMNASEDEAQQTTVESVDHGDASLTIEDQFEMAFQRRETLMPAMSALADEMPRGSARREIVQLSNALKNAEAPSDLRRSEMAIRWLPFLVSGLASDGTASHVGDFISHAALESENRGRRLRLFAYPIFVLILAFSVIAMLSFLVLPAFSTMFYEFGLRLPAPTRILMAFGNQLNSYPIETLIAVILLGLFAFFAFRLWNRFAMTTRYFGRVTAGNSANVSAMSSLTRQLAELLSINVSLSDALWIAGRNSGHHFFQGVTAELAREAHRGRLAESPMARTLPANVIHALEAGPDGQPSIPLLRELATMYGDRVADRVDCSSGAIAQFALVLVGLTVGFFIIALFMPMFSLISGLS